MAMNPNHRGVTLTELMVSPCVVVWKHRKMWLFNILNLRRIFSGLLIREPGERFLSPATLHLSPAYSRPGATLLELMIAMALLTITGLWIAASFSYMNRSLQGSRMRTLAVNLTQEQIESLKDKTYFSIIPTSSVTYNNNFNPAVPYDEEYYPPEEVNISGKKFTRYTYIERVMNSGSTLVSIPYDSLDTGLKKIIVTTVWQLGQTWYKYSASNVSANYSQASSGGFGGVVRDTAGNPIQDANIYTGGDAFNNDYTDTGGLYAFAVTPGSYTLTASAAGYFRSVSTTSYNIVPGTMVTENFTLAVMSSGSVSGAVYVNDHLVLSQIVGSTINASAWDQEYVEVFNPTTYTWTMNGIGLKFQRPADAAKKTIQISYTNPSIPSGGFYLFANTGVITAGGASLNADAVWAAGNSVSDFPYFATQNNIIPVQENGGGEGGGALELYRASDGHILDQVGWDKNDAAKAAPFSETEGYDQNIGLERTELYARISSTAGFSSVYGPSYDSGNNNKDVTGREPLNIAPRNSLSAVKPVISGTPAVGAVVTADDGLSASTTAWSKSIGYVSYATFTLVGIATGTWTVQVTSGGATLSISSVSVLTPGAATAIPNAATSPAWLITGLNNIILATPTTNGIISGRVTNASGSCIPNIKITGEPDGSATANSGGYYSMAVPEGTYSVTANPSATAPSYTSEFRTGVVVGAGQVNSGNDFVLSGAGRISGYICNANVANAYPSAAITASDLNDNVRAQTLSGSNGKFTIQNLSTGTYIVAPVLDTMQSASPASISAGVLAGQNVFAGTFTVSGAYGTIRGTATVSGAPITTGALIIATTGTISGANPPDISTAILSGTPYYMASSMADGTYAIQVRTGTASATFTLYGWYTTYSGQTPSTTKKTVTGVSVTGGQTRFQSISW